MLDIDKIKKVQADLRDEMGSGKSVKESETRLYFIDPLLNALGYEPREYGAEFHIQLGSQQCRADYYVKADNSEYVLLIEAKELGTDLLRKPTKPRDVTPYGQLRSYFESHEIRNSMSVRIGVLTDGNNYYFFTDSDGHNNLDEAPYASFRLSDLKESEFKGALERYSKSEILKFKDRKVLLADVRLQKFKTGSKQIADSLVNRQAAVPEYLIQSIAENNGIEIKDENGNVSLSQDETKEFASIFKNYVTEAYKDSIGTGEPEPIKPTTVASDTPSKPIKKEASKPTKKETASIPKSSNTKSKKIALELNQEYDIGVNADSWGKKAIDHFVINGTEYKDQGEGISLREVYCKLVKHVFDTKPDLKEQIVETYTEKRIAYTSQLKEALVSDSTPEKDKNYIKGNGWKEVEGYDVSVFMWYDADGMIRSMKKFLDRVSLPYDTVKISFNAVKSK